MILFLLAVNKQGRVRIRRNYQHVEKNEQEQRDTVVITKCLTRTNKQCNYFSHETVTVVYKKFTNLCLICGVTKDENELAVQELLNIFMDCLVSYFQTVVSIIITFYGNNGIHGSYC
ncbi:hypothetical protein BsWGS_10506 [Bradybaena similaris]